MIINDYINKYNIFLTNKITTYNQCDANRINFNIYM